jgi:hypothetical protein
MKLHEYPAHRLQTETRTVGHHPKTKGYFYPVQNTRQKEMVVEALEKYLQRLRSSTVWKK